MKKMNKIFAMPFLIFTLMLGSLSGTVLAEDIQVNMGVTGGTLSLNVPTAGTPLVLPAVSIDQIISGNRSTSVDFHDFNLTDARGSGAGWRIQLTTEAFIDGANTLPINRTSIDGSAVTPTGGVLNNIQTKTPLVDGTPYTLLSANLDAGLGSFDYSGLILAYDFLTADSQTVKAGSYVSQSTIAVVTGP